MIDKNCSYLISACLIGENCKYNGGNNLNPNIKEIFEQTTSCAVCPEILAGLGVPRARTELREGSGEEVLCGKAKAMTERGIDITLTMIRGAQKAVELAHKNGITKAILKAHSPSCGCGMIYDGSFSGVLKKGNGILAQLLIEQGFDVVSEKDFLKP
jgi:uncharacterized protein YbbK (DUF523 family)